jgi:hypothetical protein
MRRLLLVLLLVGTVAAFASPLPVNGSFEQGTPGTYTNWVNVTAGSGNISSWDVAPAGGSTVKWVSGAYQAASDGNWSVELGNVQRAASITQHLSGLAVGGKYTVTFDMWADKAITTVGSYFGMYISAGGTTSSVFDFRTGGVGTRRSDTWTRDITWEFVPTTSELDLTFAASTATYNRPVLIGGTYYGAMIDNVRLSGVPEPGLTLLFGSLLAIIPLARRLRRK